MDIYKKTYKVLLKKYKLKYLKYSKNITLFIDPLGDSSNIYNKKGIESIGYGANPKKKESKISVICDKNEDVYSLTLVDTIQKTGIKKHYHMTVKLLIKVYLNCYQMALNIKSYILLVIKVIV